MGSSPSFGLAPCDDRPVRTRCRSGSGCHCLSPATRDLSPVRSTKSTPSPHQGGSDGLGACGFRFSFTPLYRGPFHPSLAVLCTIGRGQYLALEGGPPCFRRDYTCPAVLPLWLPSQDPFADGALTRFGHPFQWCSATILVAHSGTRPAGGPQPASNPAHASVGRPPSVSGFGSPHFARHYSADPFSSSGY